jgi:phospholipid/cholesterol/gamma-HCH transport system ATP-binding protein
MPVELLAQNLGYSYEKSDLSRSLFSIQLEQKGPSINVLMGESGCGKSTLLKTLGGVLKPQQGKVFIEGIELWGHKSKPNPDLLQRIGFCFQNNALFSSLSCLENLCFAHRKRHPTLPEEERRKLANQWLHQVELAHAGFLYPHELSGGMQKRLAIARTLILEPSYLFFDDPTAGLDPISSRSIAKLLKTLLDQKQVLSWIVTNDLERAHYWSENIFTLKGGSLHRGSLSQT